VKPDPECKDWRAYKLHIYSAATLLDVRCTHCGSGLRADLETLWWKQPDANSAWVCGYLNLVTKLRRDRAATTIPKHWLLLSQSQPSIPQAAAIFALRNGTLHQFKMAVLREFPFLPLRTQAEVYGL